MKLTHINEKIMKYVDDDIINSLNDDNMMIYYKNSASVKKKINILKNILEKNTIDVEIRNNIIHDYMREIIPAGTKGKLKGTRFNLIVRDIIISLHLDENRFTIRFEKQCKHLTTSEIPDWFIYDKTTNKTLIGMNQLDFWSGGQQLNRGTKYLINNPINTEKSRMMCVICNKIILKSENKKFILFNIGFSNHTLCYPRQLHKAIKKYFNVAQ